MAAGVLETCAGHDAGHDAGAEVAIHATRYTFAHESADAVLLVDANNDFNQVNRQSALHNTSILCPSFATILKNTYGMPTRLFFTGEGEIVEGTTQSGSSCYGHYSLNTFFSMDVSQLWYAGYATAGGHILVETSFGL